MASLVKGDPVVVTGRLYTREYEHEGQRRSSVTLDAQTVAADLAHCTATVTRNRKAASPEQAASTGDDSDGGQGRMVDTSDRTEVGADAARDGEGTAPRLVGAIPGGEA
jgi:single-stranded DNA-binding protein